jgi:hypothetical protein
VKNTPRLLPQKPVAVTAAGYGFVAARRRKHLFVEDHGGVVVLEVLIHPLDNLPPLGRGEAWRRGCRGGAAAMETRS